MASRTDLEDLLKPAEDTSDVALPPRFTEALEQVRAIIAYCEGAQIPNETLLAALMAELMPRLVSTYGPAEVASVLGRLAGEISLEGTQPS